MKRLITSRHTLPYKVQEVKQEMLNTYKRYFLIDNYEFHVTQKDDVVLISLYEV